MAEKQVFIGSVGPFIFDDLDSYSDGQSYIGVYSPDSPLKGTNVITSNLSTNVRIVASNASKELEEINDLSIWVKQGSGGISVVNDLDGTVTVNLPQDLTALGSPTFAGVNITGDYVFTSATHIIRADTVDASDSKRLVLTGGGVASSARGAVFQVIGNQFGAGLGGAIVADIGGEGDGRFFDVRVSGVSKVRVDPTGLLIAQSGIRSNGNVIINSLSPNTISENGLAIKDPASDQGIFFGQATSVGFIPVMIGKTLGDAGDHALAITGEITPANDTGSASIIRLNARRTDITTIASRNLFEILNNGSSRFLLSKDGSIYNISSVAVNAPLTPGSTLTIGGIADINPALGNAHRGVELVNPGSETTAFKTTFARFGAHSTDLADMLYNVYWTGTAWANDDDLKKSYFLRLHNTQGLEFYTSPAQATPSFTRRLQVTETVFTYNANNVWHAGNDGAGSGLDADLLDGIQGSSFARTDIAETFSSHVAISGILQPTKSVVINDDSAQVVENISAGGGGLMYLQFQFASTTRSALYTLHGTATAPQEIFDISNLVDGNDADSLSGITGLDGRATIASSSTNGDVYLENRLGAQVTFNYIIIGN